MSATPTASEPALPPGALDAARAVSFMEATRVWLRIAVLSFGGSAGQIAVMHRILVEEKRWLSERRFLHALNYCMLLPGPEAQQLATYSGWLLHGVRGGLAAGTLFVLPGFFSILVLSTLYAGFQDVDAVQALFFGIKAAVLAIVVQAVVRIGARALVNGYMYAIAAGAFVAIFFFDLPFPLIVALGGVAGLVGGRLAPTRFHALGEDGADAEPPLPNGAGQHLRASAGRVLRTAAVWLALWWLPVLAIVALLGPAHVFAQIGLFFSKLALVTFGGAYAVLAYLAQEAVQGYGWVQPGEMVDALGLAESAPGPVIKVVQFVGFMAAFREPGMLDPFAAGVLASLLAAWVTFVPSFLWIFVGAPFIESTRNRALLGAALSGITATVVGVVLNLAAWFALHVLFGAVDETRIGALRLYVPDMSSLEPAAAVLTLAALVATLGLRIGMLPVLAASALLGAGYYYLA